MNTLIKAIELATLSHEETNHKYNGHPYSLHLAMVFMYGQKYIHLVPEDLREIALASCWTHDLIEDCRMTYNDVSYIMGEKVADITYALTNEKGRNRKARANDKYYKGIVDTPGALFVKICDRLANVAYSVKSGSSMIDAYRKENDDFERHLFREEYFEMFNELQYLLLK